MSIEHLPDDELPQQLLELAYDLLADDEAADLRRRIDTDPAVAQAFAEAQRTVRLLEVASSLAAPPIELVEPFRAAQEAAENAPVPYRSTTASQNKPEKPIASPRLGILASLRLDSKKRLQHWAAAIAAALLVGLTLRGYLYSLARRDNFDARNTHVVLVNPASAPANPPSVNPQPADVFGAVSPQKSVQPLPPQVAERRVDVVAINRNSPPLRSTPRPASPALFTLLSVDRPVYQPGDTLYYRSLTLHRFSLDPAEEMNVYFEVREPGGALLSGSSTSTTTEHGVASGSFPLARDLPGGQYTLHARSASGQFADQKRTFFVRQYRLPRLKKDLEFARDSYAPGDRVVADVSVDRADGAPAAGATLRSIATVDGKAVFDASRQLEKSGKSQVQFELPRGIERGDGQLAIIVDDGGTQETIAKTIRINVGRIDVSFYPEGGELVAGLENRVYFVGRNPLGKPVHLEGQVVDSAGRAVATLKTAHKGMGSFTFTPQAAESYTLKLTSPANVSSQPALPAVNPQRHVVLSTGPGVFEPGQPLTVELRSDRDDLPLSLAVYNRGVLVGQQMLAVHKGNNRVTLPLAGEAGGVVRVTVYEQVGRADAIELSPIAERLVYRRPSRALNVKVSGQHEHYAPGESVELSLSVTNERGQPTPAVLGVSVVPEGIWKMVEEETPKMTTQFYLTSEIEKPEDLEKADFYLSDDPQAPAALDLLLGTQGWRRFVEPSATETALAQASHPATRPSAGVPANAPTPLASPVTLGAPTTASAPQWGNYLPVGLAYTSEGTFNPLDFSPAPAEPRTSVLGEGQGIDGRRVPWTLSPDQAPSDGLIPTSILRNESPPAYLAPTGLNITVVSPNFSGGVADVANDVLMGTTFSSSGAASAVPSTPYSVLGTVLAATVSDNAVDARAGAVLTVGDSVQAATANTSAATFAGPASGSSAFTINSGGTVALGNAAPYPTVSNNSAALDTNTLTVSGGMLSLDNNNNTTAVNGGTFNLTGNSTYAGATSIGGGTLQFSGSGIYSGNTTITGGTPTKAGSGTLTLAGAPNTYTGATTVNAGTLALTGSNNYSGETTIFGGTLSATVTGTTTLSGANTYTGGRTATFGTIIASSGGAGGLTVGNNSGTADYGGVISDVSGVIGSNGTLHQSNAYATGTGTTVVTINGGTLTFNSGATTTIAGAINGSGNVTISSGTTLDLNGNNNTVAGVVSHQGSFGNSTASQQPPEPRPAPAREYAHLHTADLADVRSDFAETLLWQPMVITDVDGHATVKFELSDAVTTFRVVADAHSHAAPAGQGRIGTGSAQIVSRIPVSFEPKVPLEVTAGDRIDLPVALLNDTADELPVNLSLSTASLLASRGFDERASQALLEFDGPRTQSLKLPAHGRRRAYFPLVVAGQSGTAQLEIRGQAGKLADARQQALTVVPAGYPRTASYAGQLSGRQDLRIQVPRDCVPGSLAVSLRAFPSPLADIQQGIESILREPYGCFEQTSATTYPNVLALEYLQEKNLADPELTRRAKDLIRRGYQRLIGFECSGGGFEWFGQSPAHEGLTAFGLLEFREMARVTDVDPELVKRTAAWLLSRRDGQGRFDCSTHGLHTFVTGQSDICDAYIVWALSESGQEGIELELKHVIEVARKSNDPYLIALAAASALDSRDEADGRELLDRLVKLQEADGRLEARDGSITRSGGLSLQIETTALAGLAWMKRPDYWQPAKRAIDWIVGHRQDWGGFGSTQATVLALKLLVEDTRLHGRAVAGGTLTVERDGQLLGRAMFARDEWRTILIDGLGHRLQPGDNNLTLSLSGDNRMAFAIDLSYRSLTGPSDAACPLRLTTRLAAAHVKAGETVALDAELVNATDHDQPMTIAILGLPAGLESRANQLEELQKAGTIDYYETRAREVICYWRSLAPRQHVALKLDLVAEVPGQYTAPASRAYLYYTAEQKQWAEPLRVTITHE